jgi:hypothetical protein
MTQILARYLDSSLAMALPVTPAPIIATSYICFSFPNQRIQKEQQQPDESLRPVYHCSLSPGNSLFIRAGQLPYLGLLYHPDLKITIAHYLLFSEN